VTAIVVVLVRINDRSEAESQLERLVLAWLSASMTGRNKSPAFDVVFNIDRLAVVDRCAINI